MKWFPKLAGKERHVQLQDQRARVKGTTGPWTTHKKKLKKTCTTEVKIVHSFYAVAMGLLRSLSKDDKNKKCRVSALICQLFKVIILAKCVLSILGPVSRKSRNFRRHNSLCIFKTKMFSVTKLCSYFNFLYSLQRITPALQIKRVRVSQMASQDFRVTGPWN